MVTIWFRDERYELSEAAIISRMPRHILVPALRRGKLEERRARRRNRGEIAARKAAEQRDRLTQVG